MQLTEAKNRLEERIKALEKEKSMLLEEVKQLKELVELSEKAKGLESEVNSLRIEVETLKNKIPNELLKELGVLVSTILGEDEEAEEECSTYEEEEL